MVCTNRYNLLRGKIIAQFGSMQEFSCLLPMSKATFSSKINGKSDFRQNEILLIKNILNLSDEEVNDIFFTVELTKRQV